MPRRTIEKITIVDCLAEGLRSQECADQYAAAVDDKKTLYILRFKNAPKNSKIFFAIIHKNKRNPSQWKDLTDEELSRFWRGFNDYKPLITALAGTYASDPVPKRQDDHTISQETFQEVRKQIHKLEQEEEVESSASWKSFEDITSNGRKSNKSRRESDQAGSDLLPPPNDDMETETPLFTDKEEQRIKFFFGSALVDSVKKLNGMGLRNDVNFIELITALKNNTPAEKMTKEDASNNPLVKIIAQKAIKLEKKYKLKGCKPHLGKWIARILGLILLAAPGVYAGAKLGAVAGAAVGGGIFSIPAATVGAVGGIVGGWLGYKGGKRVSYSSCFFKDNIIAKADHAATIAEVINSRKLKANN